jgi:outer membrane protein
MPRHGSPFPLAGSLLAAALLGSVSARAQGAGGSVSSPPAPAPSASTSAPSTIGVAPDKAARVLTLAQVERVAQQQPQLVVARANTETAAAQADQARAPLLPQVTGTAGYTRATANTAPRVGVSLPPGTPVGGSLFSQSYDYWSFGLTGTQLLYDFGQTYDRFKAADLTVDVQRYGEQVTRLQIMLNVRTAYFNARAMKELVDVAKETLDDQNKHLAQVLGSVQVGTQPPIALAQQKAACANALVQLIQAQNNYETSKAQLNQAAGIVGGTEYDVDEEDLGIVEDEDQSLESLAAKAIAARPEIATFAKQRAAQEATLDSARGGYGPTLSASAGVSDAGFALNDMAPNWNAGILLNWPIYQGGLTKGQVRQAEAGLEGIDAQKALEVLQVRLQVDTARLAIKAAKATIGAADDALTSAKEQLRLAEQRFSTGVGNIIELGDAQVAYSTAAAQVVQARYGLFTARAQLLAALGRT